MSSWMTRVLHDKDESLIASVLRMSNIPVNPGDGPLPSRYEARESSVWPLAELERRLNEFVTMSDEEIQQQIDAVRAHRQAAHTRECVEMRDRARRYLNRLCELHAWQPPAAMLALKTELIKQLESAMVIELDRVTPPSEAPSPAQWREEKIAQQSRHIWDVLERDDNSRERADQFTEALRGLYRSLGIEYTDEFVSTIS